MTDREIELLYKSVKSVEELLEQLALEKDLEIEHGISMTHRNGQIEVTINSKVYSLDRHYLQAILSEFQQQQVQDQVNERAVNRLDKRMDLEKIEKDKYYAHQAFLLDLIYVRDVSSGQGAYRRKLGDIVKLFRAGKTLVTDKNTYKHLNEFVDDYLKGQYGFTTLENELKRK